jgi:predicted SPOUT superfamily RNA methylase MTH1
VELAGRENAHDYWGYVVSTPSLAEAFMDPRFQLKVATSRYGNSLQSQVFRLRESIKNVGSIELIFGSPMRGLYDMVGRELSQKVDFVVNLFAEQHVETVRTEEAVYAGLNLLNILVT